MENLVPCPNCGGRALYRGPAMSSGGGYAPDFLPGLGRRWEIHSSATFVLVVCRDCGLTRFFVAEPEVRARLEESDKWTAI